MHPVDHMVDELAPDWEEDAIYCEATCGPEDVLYQGSDDEDYDSPSSRRLRYEAAGQRFLDGVEPLILTASLRGPFDRASGWVNPWRSKNRTAQGSRAGKLSRAKSVPQLRQAKAISIPETVHGDTQDSLKCHLPSPESLKQAAVVEEAHPYLEEDELAMVQNWRSAVQPTSMRDSFWNATPKEKKSIRKRKARGSGWLKKLAAKRQRTDIMETGSVNTPVPRRPQTAPPQDESTITSEPNVSFGSTSSQLPLFKTHSQLKRRASQPTSSSPINDAQDELVEPIYDSNPVTGQPGPSARRISPRRDVQKPDPKSSNNDFDDELSRDQIAAAATLSSPISQSHRSTSPRESRVGRESSQQHHQGSSQAKEAADPRIDTEQDSLIGETRDSERGMLSRARQDFQTQEDQSFLFRMRTKPASKHSPGPGNALDQQAISPVKSVTSAEESWSGLCETPLSDAGEVHFDFLTEGAIKSDDIDAPMSDAEAASESGSTDTSSSDLSSLSTEEFGRFQSSMAEAKDAGDDGTQGEETSPSKSEEDESCVVEAAVEQTIDVIAEESSPEAQQVVFPSFEVLADPASSSTTEGITVVMDDTTLVPMSQKKDGTNIRDRSSLTSMNDQEIESLAPSRKAPTPPTNVLRTLPQARASGPPQGALLLKSAVRPSVSRRSWAGLSQSSAKAAPSPAPGIKSQGKRNTLQDDISTASDEETETESESEPERDRESDSDYEQHEARPKNRRSRNAAGRDKTTPIQEAEPVGSQTAEGMDVDGGQSQPLPCSQQSPWAISKLSQSAATVMTSPPEGHANTGPAIAQEQTGSAPKAASPEAQTPWTHDTEQLSEPPILAPPQAIETAQGSPLPGEEVIEETSLDSPAQNHLNSITPAITPRSSTPEPQFSVKSFASFMSPSPERRARQPLRAASWRNSGSRLPSTQGILASATKNPWSANSSRRVSWAPLPQEKEGISTPTTAEELPSTQTRARQASPPPSTPIADLPTGQDAKFHDHFTAVARRTNVLRQRLLPSESQRTVGTPDPQAMAEKFLQADEAMQLQSDEPEVADVPAEREVVEDLPTMKNVEPLQESGDIVEDVLREMSDYLETWNVDADLEQARLQSSVQKPQATPLVQSPW